MRARIKRIVCGVAFCYQSATSIHAGGLDLIRATDDEIRIHLGAAVAGAVRLLEIEPYDTLNPLRGLVENSPGSQQLDLSNEGFLRMTFLNGSPFDPQIQFPAYPVNADYVGKFSMRVRVSGTQGGADMPFRIYGFPAYADVLVPSDGAWHIVRADMTATNWSGIRTLRIDPANAQGYAANQAAVVDIDWAAVTYRNDFSGDRNHTGLDVFIDLGVPENSWSGSAQPMITLPRYDGVRDRLFSKYVLIDGSTTNQIGSPRYVTDLSGLSYVADTTDLWASLNTANGMMAPIASNGILVARYSTPSGTWDPAIQASATQRANLDVAKEFAMKYRIVGYSGNQPTIPSALYGFVEGETGSARLEDVLVPDGQWHVYRVRLDQSVGTLSWHGNVRLRIDAPNGLPATYPAAHFAGGSLDLDWAAISDDPLFTPSRPLVAGGRLWTFSKDRTRPLTAPAGFKGLNGPDSADIVDLGCDSQKMNFLQTSALSLVPNPATVWPVDEFNIGINTSYINNTMKPTIKYFTDNGVESYITSLNSIQNYWLDEGTPTQRFNPVRNYLSVTNPPNAFSVAHNVMDPVGIAYYRGTMEYLANTFSDPSGDNGELFRFIIGNELDAHWSWYNLGNIELEKVVDIYLTSCRMADLALRKIHPDFRVYLSFTHFWNKALNANSLQSAKPKDLLDLFAAKAEAEGDFPWGVCIHPYPVSLFNPQFWNDAAPTDDFNTEYITFKNLQVMRRYLQQDSMLYNGQSRPIILGEQGFHVPTDGNATDEAIQAAALAYSCKITEQVPGVEAYLYHRQIDHSLEGTLRFGLGSDDPLIDGYQYLRKRPSWDVMHDYNTANEAATFNPYLSYLPISAWSDIHLADIELRYEFTEPDPDITTINLPIFGTSNGVFFGTATIGDPQINNLHVNTYGDGQETCLLRIKATKTGNWQLFWKRVGDVAFAGTRSVTFPVAASGGFGIYKVDLSTNALWVGQNIIAWRLDPVNPTTSYDFEIDYMLFGPKDDFDGDGIPDAQEGLADIDGDGLPNLADLDSNGNGYSDARESLLGLVADSTDSDADGAANDWETQYGFDPFDGIDGGWDLDADGYDNRAEYIAVTDPTNPLDYFIISGLAAGTNVYVDGKAGRIYTLMRSTNLVSNVWNPVATLGPVASDMSVALVDTNINASGMYKVEVSD